MPRVSRRRGLHPCWPGFASGSHESVASKEIEHLDKLKDAKSLLSGYSSDFQPWQGLRVGGKCHYLFSHRVTCSGVILLMISINKVDRNKQETKQELTGSGVTSDSELSLS